MKISSDNRLIENEMIAKNIIDIHTKGHLLYVDYGDQNATNGIKELKMSPKNSDLGSINYSSMI